MQQNRNGGRTNRAAVGNGSRGAGKTELQRTEIHLSRVPLSPSLTASIARWEVIGNPNARIDNRAKSQSCSNAHSTPVAHRTRMFCNILLSLSAAVHKLGRPLGTHLNASSPAGLGEAVLTVRGARRRAARTPRLTLVEFTDYQ